MRRIGFCLVLAGLAPAIAHAQPARSGEEADQNVQVMIDNSKQLYGVTKPAVRCSQGDPNEIVVCVDRGRDQSMPSSEPDPNTLEGRRSLNGGIPRAPQFDHGSCRGQPGCITGGWAPPPAYYVDVTALPQAPEGSDADKIAKGEAPAP